MDSELDDLFSDEDDFEKLPKNIQEFRRRVLSKYGFAEEPGPVENQYPDLEIDVSSGSSKDHKAQILIVQCKPGVPDETIVIQHMREVLNKVDEIALVMGARFDPDSKFRTIDRAKPIHLPTQTAPKKDVLRVGSIYKF